MHVLERNRKERNCTGTLLKEMLKRKHFTNNQVLKGFELVLQTAEDFLGPVEVGNLLFIRALATAVIESSVDGKNLSSFVLS